MPGSLNAKNRRAIRSCTYGRSYGIGSVTPCVFCPCSPSCSAFGKLAHILIKAFEGNLTPHERNVLTADPEWSISAIVLWEIAKSHRLGRVAYGRHDETFAAAVDQVHVWPITRKVCLNLRGLGFRSDPADEIIAATRLTHNIPLLTRDSRIRKSKAAKLA